MAAPPRQRGFEERPWAGADPAWSRARGQSPYDGSAGFLHKWEHAFAAWAEAEGIKGQMTRTWYSLAGAEVFAVAGLWRPTEEWGAAYSMVMVDGCPQMAEVHDRMPVVLARENWEQWLAGTPAEAFALCQTCFSELAIDRTAERWGAGRAAATSG